MPQSLVTIAGTDGAPVVCRFRQVGVTMGSEKGDDNEPPAQAVFGLKEGDETVSPIGNRVKGQSPYGIHDLAGNLYEWTMDWYDEQFYSTNPTVNPRGSSEGTAKMQRGGSYTNTPYRLRSTFRTKGDPTQHEPNVGFRCAQDTPPLP